MSSSPPPPAPTASPPLPASFGFWPRLVRPVGAVLLAFGISIPVAATLAATSLSDDGVAAIFTVVGSALIALFALAFLFALPAHERRLTLAVKHSVGGTIGLGVTIGIGIIITSAALILLGTVIDGGLEDRLEDQAVSIGTVPWQAILMVIALVILAPLGEELVFRGLLLRALARRLAFWPAALITALLFAASHADSYVIWPRAIALTLTGIALAWIYRWRGYWASVTAHATVNLVAAIALLAAG